MSAARHLNTGTSGAIDRVHEGSSLVAENRKYRLRAQIAEQHVERLRAVVAEQDRMLLVVWLRGVLADPADFWRYIDPAAVLGDHGELVWTAVDREVEQLLTERPYLATPEDYPWSRGARAVEWFQARE